MEDQSLIPSPKDNGEKQKKGCKPGLTVLFTTIVLLVLVFYGGEYWGSPRALGVGTTDDDYVIIPIGDPCLIADDNCAIPPGLEHGYCGFVPITGGQPGPVQYECQNGQPGASCDNPSDCVIPKGLDHAVCRDDKCQSGQAGARCGQTSDCLPIAGLSPPHAVCRKDKCQR